MRLHKPLTLLFIAWMTSLSILRAQEPVPWNSSTTYAEGDNPNGACLDIADRRNGPWSFMICARKLSRQSSIENSTTLDNQSTFAWKSDWLSNVVQASHETFCFPMVFVCSKSKYDTPKPCRVALLKVRTNNWSKCHRNFYSWFQNRSLAQIGTARRFRNPSTSIHEFLVRGGTISSQGPKVCEGSQNRHETLPNKSADKAS